MRLAHGDVLTDALELFHTHVWREVKPAISDEQMAELVPVLAPLFQASRPKRRAAKQNKPPKVDKGSQHEGRTRVYGRSDRECEIQVDGVCTGRASEWHHRKDRNQGGTWHASNGLDACSPCHLYVTTERTVAKRHGWAVEPWHDPAEVPVLRRGRLVKLDDEGGFTPVEEAA